MSQPGLADIYWGWFGDQSLPVPTGLRGSRLLSTLSTHMCTTAGAHDTRFTHVCSTCTQCSPACVDPRQPSQASPELPLAFVGTTQDPGHCSVWTGIGIGSDVGAMSERTLPDTCPPSVWSHVAAPSSPHTAGCSWAGLSPACPFNPAHWLICVSAPPKRSSCGPPEGTGGTKLIPAQGQPGNSPHVVGGTGHTHLWPTLPYPPGSGASGPLSPGKQRPGTPHISVLKRKICFSNCDLFMLQKSSPVLQFPRVPARSHSCRAAAW